MTVGRFKSDRSNACCKKVIEAGRRDKDPFADLAEQGRQRHGTGQLARTGRVDIGGSTAGLVLTSMHSTAVNSANPMCHL